MTAAPASPAYVAQLRVYDPLSAFPEPERTHWAGYAVRRDAPDPATGIQREHEAGVAALAGQRVPLAGANEAFVRVHRGEVFVCPWRTEVRSWLALVEFCAGLPDELAAAFVPPAVAENAERDLEKWIANNPELHLHIRASTWHVPLRWLFLFEGSERELVLPERRRGGARAGAQQAERICRYLTTMAHARRRAARGLATLRKAFDDGPVVAGVEEVARWLEEFHPHALVELDYGGLVQLFSDEELSADDSPALLAATLKALGDGDGQVAGEKYEQVMERWRRVQVLENAN